METPLINCGAQLHGNVLVNDYGNAVRHLLLHWPTVVCAQTFVVYIMTLLFRKKRVGLLDAHVLVRFVAFLLYCLLMPQFELTTD